MNKVYIIMVDRSIVEYVASTRQKAYDYLDENIENICEDFDVNFENIKNNIIESMDSEDDDWRDYMYHSDIVQIFEYEVDEEY